jgi:hypothetical protein
VPGGTITNFALGVAGVAGTDVRVSTFSKIPGSETIASASNGGPTSTTIIRLRRLYFMVHGLGGFGAGAEEFGKEEREERLVSSSAGIRETLGPPCKNHVRCSPYSGNCFSMSRISLFQSCQRASAESSACFARSSATLTSSRAAFVRLCSTNHATARATTTVSQSKSRMENLNHPRFGVSLIWQAPQAVWRMSLDRFSDNDHQAPQAVLHRGEPLPPFSPRLSLPASSFLGSAASHRQAAEYWRFWRGSTRDNSPARHRESLCIPEFSILRKFACCSRAVSKRTFLRKSPPPATIGLTCQKRAAVSRRLFHARAGRIGDMKDAGNKGGASRTLVFAFIGLLVCLPVLYVLSCGPATWLNEHRYISAETMKAIYDPLGWACVNCKPLQDAVGWYLDFWRLPPGPVP